MSVTNGERLVTKQDLADFYDNIRPYMGGVVTSKAGFTPIGTIISVMGTTAPANYLACDGTVYNIADYTELANYFNDQFGSKNYFGGDGTITFAVPDLRGEFLRGTGTNSHENQGSGGAVGEHQDGTNCPNFGVTSSGKLLGRRLDSSNINVSNADNVYFQSDGAFEGSSSSISSKYNTFYIPRPTNTSVLYCIATKNFYVDPTLDYSTDEKVVGTWINGKTIYQRTFQDTLPNVTSQATPVDKYIELNISIDTFVKVEGFMRYTNGVDRPLNTCYKAQAEIVYNYVGGVPNSATTNANTIQLTNSHQNWNGMPCYITIQYTKTTGT